MENLLDKTSYVGVKEASEFLGVSSVTARKWIKNGELKCLVVKSPKNKKDMYVIHKEELKFFKDTIMPCIYKNRNVPKVYRKKDSLCKRFLEWLRNALHV